tara:strand:+ start:250 stop:594 length:345 start_codon:yes stop_codon:yes gene_type:complete
MLIASSCGTSFGEKYTIGNLEIYFTEDISNRYVEGLGKYFNDHHLIQNETHSVQLTSDTESFILKMVLNDEYKSLPSAQKKNLELLTADLQHKVFRDLPFKIQICDMNFNPIEQ